MISDEELAQFNQLNVGIIAHGDADGICSAAIVKSLYPGSDVIFTRANQLHKAIKDLEDRVITLDILFILDLAINPKKKEYVLQRLENASKRYKIYYFDNHTLPKGMDESEISKFFVKFITKRNWSTSAVTFRTLFGDKPENLKNNRYQALLGAYGAISDYAKECPLLHSILDLYDESNTYYQAFLLKQASRVIDKDNIKRVIVDKLSVGILPSEIFEVVEAAREASREVDIAVEYIHKHAKKIDLLGVIFECPVASMGHNAYIASTITQTSLGVAIRRTKGKAHFTLRRRQFCRVHLGELATNVANDLDCEGGGEEATAGISAPDTMISQVLERINHYATICMNET